MCVLLFDIAARVLLADLLSHAPPRRRLATLPTPVERARWLDIGPSEVWIKRDDQSSSLYGGGKVRKLEWILANPPYADERPILSVGGIGSHHLVALALFLREQGRALHALTFDQVFTPHVRQNLAVLTSADARLWSVQTRARLPLAWLRYRHEIGHRERGVWMEPGASTPLGCLGFVEAGLELAEQIRQHSLPRPRTIFVTAGTAGTAAGLILGLAWAGVSTHLRLVSSVEPWAFGDTLFRRKLYAAHRLLKTFGGRELPRDPIALLRRTQTSYSIDHAEVGRGYGVPTNRATEAVTFARNAGMTLETTYTGKCMAALLRSGARGPILFWNTHAANDLRTQVREGWQDRLPSRLRALALASEH